MSQETIFLLHTMRLGVWTAFLYDILRIWRRLSPRGILRVSLEDPLFWIYCTAAAFLLMYRENNGSLRWFAVLGVTIGVYAYLKLISPFFVKYSVRLLKPFVLWLRRFGRFLKKMLTAPGRVLKMNLQRLFRALKHRLARQKTEESDQEEIPDNSSLGK